MSILNAKQRTVGEVIAELRKFPADAKCYVLEEERPGITIRNSYNEQFFKTDRQGDFKISELIDDGFIPLQYSYLGEATELFEADSDPVNKGDAKG